MLYVTSARFITDELWNLKFKI